MKYSFKLMRLKIINRYLEFRKTRKRIKADIEYCERLFNKTDNHNIKHKCIDNINFYKKELDFIKMQLDKDICR